MDSIMTIRAPIELQDELLRGAKSLGLTRNALVLQILWEWKKQNTPEQGQSGNEDG